MQKPRYMIELRSAVVAGIVAVLVAAPLSDAAYTQAGHVVKIVKGKRGKTGKRGPRGRTGPVGATGPQGAPGRDATRPGLYAAKQILPGETVTVLAGGCIPHGVDAGSFSVTGGTDPGLTLVRDGIGGGDLYYFAVVTNTTDESAEIKASALCN